MDRVFIEGLNLKGMHGVSERERSSEQEFVVDIAVTLDTDRAVISDSIGDTIDYRCINEITRTVLSGASVCLIETLGSAIADRVLNDARVTEVSVTVRKPMVFANGVPGVTIVRSRTKYSTSCATPRSGNWTSRLLPSFAHQTLSSFASFRRWFNRDW
jgi:dihydroneopterin aldolase